MKIKVLTFLFSIIFISTACNKADNQGVATDGQNTIVDGAEITPVFLLKNMTAEEIEAVAEDCPAESDKPRCVVICHVPPRNPRRAKTLMMPLPALQAHLNYGSDQHNHHDFVGPCSQLPELNKCHPANSGKGKVPKNHELECENHDSNQYGINEGSTNNDGTIDNAENNANDDTSDQDNMINDNSGLDIPIYCDPDTVSDFDCDGLDDETIESIY